MAIRLNSSSLVTIYGGSGFIGGQIVGALARTGCRMRVAVRRPDLAGHLRPLGAVGQIHPVQANVRDLDSVRAAAREADALVNLVGILHEGGRQTFDSVQAQGARNVARVAKDAGIETVVHASSIGADPESPSVYARTKAEGEAAMRDLAPGAVVFRPSVVFGPGDGFFSRFASLARIFPALPLIGGGETKFQPVYVGDVARAVLTALSGEARPGAVYELGGPEILTLREVFEKVLRHTQRRRLLLPLPFALARLQARVLQLLPNPMLTVDQVRQLAFDNVVGPEAESEGRTLQGLGIEPVAADAILPTYLERFRPRGQFSTTYRD